MAREAAIRVVCDRTGEASYVQAGVTLDNMNEGASAPDAALEITFRPVHGSDGVELVFNDLSERAEKQVKELIDAISAEGYFVVSPLESDSSAEPQAATDAPASAGAAPAADPPKEKPKGRPRRTHLQIEADLLDEAVEAASSAMSKLMASPDAEDMDVADAREALTEALTRSEYFKGLTEKEQRVHTKEARKARKVGNPVSFPEKLPAVDPAVLGKFGLLEDEGEDHGDHPDAPPDGVVAGDDDDEDIFASPEPTEESGEQVDFL